MVQQRQRYQCPLGVFPWYIIHKFTHADIDRRYVQWCLIWKYKLSIPSWCCPESTVSRQAVQINDQHDWADISNVQMRGIDLRSQDKTAFMSDFVLFIYLVTFNIGVPTTLIKQRWKTVWTIIFDKILCSLPYSLNDTRCTSTNCSTMLHVNSSYIRL